MEQRIKFVPSWTKVFTITLGQGNPLPKERGAMVMTHRFVFLIMFLNVVSLLKIIAFTIITI